MAISKKIPAVGTKSQVWNGNAKHTAGGLTKKDILRKPTGNGNYRYVSKRKSERAKAMYNKGLKGQTNKGLGAFQKRTGQIPKRNVPVKRQLAKKEANLK